MTNAKWLALLAACGLALTMAACDGDDEDQCPDGAMCLAEAGACDAHCDIAQDACQSDEDCGDDEICDTDCGSGVCIIPCTPEDGTGGTGGGGDTCLEQADCYPDSYCGEGDQCFSLADYISECNYGPDAPTGTGPMLLTIEQMDEAGTGFCTKDPANCLNNGNVCWFRIGAYDPDGDFPATGLYDNTKFVRSTDGAIIATFNARNGAIDPNNSKFFDFEVSGCYPEEATDLGGGFLLLDEANQQSNTACVSFANGTAP